MERTGDPRSRGARAIKALDSNADEDQMRSPAAVYKRPPWRVRRLARWSLSFVAALWVALVLQLAFKFVTGESADLVEGIVSNAVMVAASLLCAWRAVAGGEERGGWALLAVALGFSAVGDIYYSIAFFGLDEVPVPSPADVAYLAFYPLAYIGLVSILRARLPRLDPLLRVDGLIGALAFAALGGAVVFQAVAATSEGSSVAVAVNLAYPIGDLILLSLVVGTFVGTGKASVRTWAWLGGGIALTGLADAIYLYAAARWGYVNGALLDALWPAGSLLIAVAAWRAPVKVVEARREGWRTIALPLAFASLALAIGLYDHFERLHFLPLLLATAAVLAVFIRLVLTFAENARMLSHSRVEAKTDPLTGLGNRRQLTLDLSESLARIDERPALALALYDLDGFKQYNDTFGHPAGDVLLARLGKRLAEAVAGSGTAYRMGGDEFCVLAEADGDGVLSVVERAALVLSERGRGFELGVSYGVVLLPSEALSGSEALRLADQRMYRRKYARSGSVRHQTTEVLLQALSESRPDLGAHPKAVAALAEATARQLGLSEEETESVRLAGALHDIGKMAVPEEILSKGGSLDEREREFIRRHPVIGERIIGVAPALRNVAKLVRSSHERVDGAGYPDGLRGEEIPLGARIIAACDAFEVMVSGRVYRVGRTTEEARDELRRCAGCYFDAQVVEALCAVLGTDESLVASGSAEHEGAVRRASRP